MCPSLFLLDCSELPSPPVERDVAAQAKEDEEVENEGTSGREEHLSKVQVRGELSQLEMWTYKAVLECIALDWVVGGHPIGVISHSPEQNTRVKDSPTPVA